MVSAPTMRVTIRLFATLRERAGAGELELDLPEGACVDDALAALTPLTRDLPVVLAVNRSYAAATTRLHAGDELALVPPVSGGAAVRVHSAVVDGALSLDALVERVADPAAGAIVTFSGVTRGVEHLEYEAYAEMAAERLRRIAEEVAAAHDVCAVAVEHRTGVVRLSGASVLVAASAPHRPAAFAAARALIDRVKAEAPIWKKEVSDGCAAWVRGTLPEIDAVEATR